MQRAMEQRKAEQQRRRRGAEHGFGGVSTDLGLDPIPERKPSKGMEFIGVGVRCLSVSLPFG